MSEPTWTIDGADLGEVAQYIKSKEAEGKRLVLTRTEGTNDFVGTWVEDDQ